MLGIPASTPTSVVMFLIERRTSSKVLKAPPPQESHSDSNSAIVLSFQELSKTSGINDRSQDEPPLYISQTIPKTLSASNRGGVYGCECQRSLLKHRVRRSIDERAAMCSSLDWSRPSSYNCFIIACAFSGHVHLTDASATAAMRLKSPTCKVSSQHRQRCRGRVRQRLLLQRPLVA